MTDYGYCHARARGMKSRLLSPDFFDKLMASREVGEVTARLNDSVYGADIHNGLLRFAGVAGVEEGLRLNLAAAFESVLDLVDGDARRLVEMLLERWDVANIKTVLRGKHVGAGSDEIIGSFVPAGALNEGVLVALAQEPDIKAAIDLMATWGMAYSRPLTREFPTYANTHGLGVLEIALDRHYYAGALAELDEIRADAFSVSLVRNLIMRQIDFINVMTLLKLAHEKARDEGGLLFLDGGREIDRDLFDRLSSSDDVNAVVAGLSGTSYADRLAEGMKAYEAIDSFAALERALEDGAIRKVAALFRAEPLSLTVIVAYLWAKINEVMNIRIVLRGKEAGMPPAAIRDALVVID